MAEFRLVTDKLQALVTKYLMFMACISNMCVQAHMNVDDIFYVKDMGVMCLQAHMTCTS